MICESCKRKQNLSVTGDRWTVHHGKSEIVMASFGDEFVDATEAYHKIAVERLQASS